MLFWFMDAKSIFSHVTSPERAGVTLQKNVHVIYSFRPKSQETKTKKSKSLVAEK